MKKRMLSLLLALVMVLALVPTVALAEDGESVNPTYVYVTETGKLEEAVKAVYGSGYQAGAVTALKVATADGAYLDPTDFAYLKGLPSLTYLDFADADCANNTIPDNAFGNYFGETTPSASLKTVILSKTV